MRGIRIAPNQFDSSEISRGGELKREDEISVGESRDLDRLDYGSGQEHEISLWKLAQ